MKLYDFKVIFSFHSFFKASTESGLNDLNPLIESFPFIMRKAMQPKDHQSEQALLEIEDNNSGGVQNIAIKFFFTGDFDDLHFNVGLFSSSSLL